MRILKKNYYYYLGAPLSKSKSKRKGKSKTLVPLYKLHFTLQIRDYPEQNLM